MTDSPSLHIGKDEYKAVNITDVRPANQQMSSGSLFERLNEWVIVKSPLKLKEKVAFFRLLATMINAGVSLIKALYILEEQTQDQKMKRICQSIALKIELGQKLSQGLEDYPEIFTDSEIGMVRSGEASGRLNDILITLADEVEKNAKLRGKIKGAMMYPLAIIVVVIAVFVTVTVLVIPKMQAIFETAGAELPSSTKFLMAMSNFFRGSFFGIPNFIFIILGTIGLGVAFKMWKNTESGKYYWDKFFLKIPIFGTLKRKLVLTQFANNISTLTKSGISIVKTLKITSDVVGNEVYKRRILLIAEDVKQGITIGENIKGDIKIFPTMLVSMIAIGEQTAQLDTVTAKVADFYQDEVDTMVKSLSSLMEPFIIVFIGGIVGFMVSAIMQPVLQLSDVASSL